MSRLYAGHFLWGFVKADETFLLGKTISQARIFSSQRRNRSSPPSYSLSLSLSFSFSFSLSGYWKQVSEPCREERIPCVVWRCVNRVSFFVHGLAGILIKTTKRDGLCGTEPLIIKKVTRKYLQILNTHPYLILFKGTKEKGQNETAIELAIEISRSSI